MALARRRARLLGVVVAVVVTGLLGYLAGNHIRSPADALADAAPPRDSVLTADVRWGALEQRTVSSGTIEWPRTVTVPAATSTSGLRPVVTRRNRAPGQTVRAAQVLVEIAYRPVIVLPGEVPMLRDLRRGDRGPDVTALQAGLEAAGYPVFDEDGQFGASTQRAIESLYQANGYEAPRLAEATAGSTEDESNEETGDEGVGGERDGGEEDAPESGAAIGASAAEFVFVNKLPARVLSYAVGVGQEVQESIAVLAEGNPVIRANLSTEDAASLEPGTRVGLRVVRIGRDLAGRVSNVGAPQQSEELGLYVPVTITPNKPIRPRLVGTNAEVNPAPAADRPEGLLVPVSALFTSASGGVGVRLLEQGDEQVVPVRVLETSAGVARVDPVESGRLDKGDKVVIGVRR